jgi:hypothetical protein
VRTEGEARPKEQQQQKKKTTMTMENLIPFPGMSSALGVRFVQSISMRRRRIVCKEKREFLMIFKTPNHL